MDRLKHLEQLRQVLSGYRISDQYRDILEQTKVVLLVAPTSAGRNTVIRELLNTGDYHFIVSNTTRQPRVNDGVAEQNGKEYWFKTEEEVLSDLKNGKFLEAAIIHNQQVSGISIKELQKAHQTKKIAITDIEIAGVESIMAAKPDTTAVFLVPPNFDEWQRRLRQRSQMSQPEVNRRLQSAEAELAAALENKYYKFVINDDLDNAVAQVHQIAKLGLVDHDQQETARRVVEQLLVEVEGYLLANQSKS